MKFELKKVVPWGRNLNEYIKMFSLNDEDLNKRIIGFGDGPASFNSEMIKSGKKVLSVDPVYQFSKDELEQRILESKEDVIKLTKQNSDNFHWTQIKNLEELEQIRMTAMRAFLDDFESGKSQGRFLPHSLPNSLDFGPMEFDLGLSSHFLVLYSQLGLEFHINSIIEMLRICKEIRIFPLLDLDSKPSGVLDGIIDCFQRDYRLQIVQVDYEFQKNGNKMLVIKH